MLGRQEQVEALLGQRDEVQPVGQRGRLARHARVGQTADDGRRHLQVTGGHAVVAGKLGGLEAEPQAFPVEQRARLRSGFAVDQPQPLPGHVVQAADLGSGTDHQALAPGGEPDHRGAAGDAGCTRCTGCVVALSRADAVHACRVHQAGRGQAQGLAAAARPPGERQRRVKQRERRLEQR
jgi:hypothetical protein